MDNPHVDTKCPRLWIPREILKFSFLGSVKLNLGMRYSIGKGVRQDHKKAFDLYSKAFEQGCIEAQNGLGLCYFNGFGVEQDVSKAFKYFSEASKKGCAKAHISLGDCYYLGLAQNRILTMP